MTDDHAPPRAGLHPSSSIEMISVHDLAGRYLSVTSTSLRLIGYEPEELVGRSAYELFHPADLAAVEESHRQVVESDEMPTATYRIRRKDGTFVWLQTRSYQVPGREELVAVTRALSAVELEGTRAVSDVRFRLAMQHAPIGMAIVSLEGRFVEVNQSLCAMLGYSPAELTASTFADLTHPEDLEGDLENVRRLLDGELTSYQMHKRYLHQSGAVVWAELTVALLRGGSGAPLYFLSQIQDITERLEQQRSLERTTEALARSNAELERYAYVASHDLKEPLRKVQVFADRLERLAGPELSDRARDCVTRMRRASNRMSELVDDLLALSRVGAEQSRLRTVDLDEVLQAVLSSLSVRIEEEDASIHVDPLGQCEAEPRQLEQLFQNLIGNALKYRKPDVAPRIELTARRTVEETSYGERRDWVEIRVADNGIGFHPEEGERIFEVFQRLHGRDQYSGSGVGLAICKKVVDRLGGSIEAHGRPGEGATFVVRILTGGAPPPAAHSAA